MHPQVPPASSSSSGTTPNPGQQQQQQQRASTPGTPNQAYRQSSPNVQSQQKQRWAQSNTPGATGQQPQQQQPFSQADLNRIVLEYLGKKGYVKTEAMLRLESSRTPTPSFGGAKSTPQQQLTQNGMAGGQRTGQAESTGRPGTPGPSGQELTSSTTSAASYSGFSDPDEEARAYIRVYGLLRDWVDTSLDLYKPQLRRVLYPLFLHSYFDLIQRNQSTMARKFFDLYSEDHKLLHNSDLQAISGMSLPEHLMENETAKLYRSHKYRLDMSRTTLDLLLFFLQENDQSGGSIFIRLINQFIDTHIVSARPSRFDTDTFLSPNEGIPQTISGPGSNQAGDYNKQPVKLGRRPLEPEAKREVLATLKQKDDLHPPSSGMPSLIEQFDEIKQEEEDSPLHDSVPLPPFKRYDIQAEVQSIEDYRSRLKIDPSQASLPSVCMYTFHNTYQGFNCVDFSSDLSMAAGGFADSYIKIWNLKGENLKSIIPGQKNTSSKRLVGHSGPVYGVSFSPDNRYLLSSSQDKTVRLWSLDTLTALVSYKGHDHPVWDVAFSPYGHYFATASHDQTARLWSTDHIYPLRIFAGHLSDVDCVTFHPNTNYVLTGSSDKTCRMWDINRGNCVRVMIGHTAPINCLAVSPDGRWLASAGEDSIINLWDLGSGRRLKSMRGHGKASIYSLAFSKEGSVLVSGAADCSVRVWDVKRGTSDRVAEPEPFNVAGVHDTNGSSLTGITSGSDTASATEGAGDGSLKNQQLKKVSSKQNDIQSTLDHLAVFRTKRTPVYKIAFTSKNLCIAGGAYEG